jgi:hypothetical protein
MAHTGLGLVAGAVAAVVIGCFSPQPAAAAETKGSSRASVVVRTYTRPDLQDGMGTARSAAGDILRRAGVEVAWIECGLTAAADAAAACARPLESNELIVRILPAGGEGRGPDLEMLGFAYVDVATGGGSLATVYTDRVDRVAQSAGVDPAELLGRAMAHEIGHLLLGTNRHSRHGLMRPSWTDDDLRRRVTNEWLFNGREAEVMRDAIANRLRSYN